MQAWDKVKHSSKKYAVVSEIFGIPKGLSILLVKFKYRKVWLRRVLKWLILKWIFPGCKSVVRSKKQIKEMSRRTSLHLWFHCEAGSRLFLEIWRTFSLAVINWNGELCSAGQNEKSRLNVLSEQVVKHNARFLLRSRSGPGNIVWILKAVSGSQLHKDVQYGSAVLSTANCRMWPIFLRWHVRVLLGAPACNFYALLLPPQ